MRTTLKRGVGRGATLNGNGHVSHVPVLPAPVTHYRQPLPRHRFLRGFARWFGGFFALAAMVGAAVAGGSYLYFDQSLSDVAPRTKAVREVSKRLNVPQQKQPAIALVVGYDKRAAGPEANLGGRSDTLMLLRADPDLDTISMLSFPRDLQVDIRCPGQGPYPAPITTAYATCGLRGAVDTVRGVTGLPIHYLITVDFKGFRHLVDKLGGVWLDVDRRYFNDNSSGGLTYATIDLQPGYQKVKGQDALDFVRFRHTDSDLHRVARQQLFMRAMKERISSYGITGALRVVDTARKNVEVGFGGGRKLPKKTVLSWALFAYKLPAGQIFRTRIDNIYGSGTVADPLRTDSTNIETAVQDFLRPDTEAPDKAVASALNERIKLQTGPPPSRVTVSTLNGNNVEGSASNARFLLAERGYQTFLPPNGIPANAPRFDYFRTEVQFDPGQAGARLAGARVRNLFGAAHIRKMTSEIRGLSNGAMLVVIVGQTFHGRLAPAPVDRTPKREPARVVKSPPEYRQSLRALQRRVDFPLLVPTVIDRSSRLASQSPIRVYGFKRGERTLRMTFVGGTGYNEYWGIQQASWEDAPALEGKSVHRRIKGRDYDLHFNGPKLHMVVLRDGDSSYWVVNTLLDSISNETMLAIAKGLKPLR